MATGRDVALTLAVGAVAAAALAADYLSTPFDQLFEREAASSGVPADLLRAIARRESSFRAAAVGKKNSNGSQDFGLLQVNNVTAKAMGFDVGRLLEPAYNAHVAAAYLLAVKRELGTHWSPYTWVAAYNAGAPAILRRGVFNVGYASEVTWHWQLYQVASAVRAVIGGRP